MRINNHEDDVIRRCDRNATKESVGVSQMLWYKHFHKTVKPQLQYFVHQFRSI